MKAPTSTDFLCIASGPSLTLPDVEIARRWRDVAGGKVIAINNNFQLAPWADIIYACDGQWWKFHYKAVRETCGGEFVAYSREACELFGDIKHEEKLLGGESGYQAIRLAERRGARIIYLLGYDYQHTDGKVHWHPDHPWPMTNIGVTMVGKEKKIVGFDHRPSNGNGKSKIMEMNDLAADLSKRGIVVVNHTRSTALKCFQRLPIEALGL